MWSVWQNLAPQGPVRMLNNYFSLLTMCEVCIGKISNLQYVTVLTAGVKQWLRSIQKTQKANKKLHVLFSQYGPARTCSIAETNIKKVQDLDNLYVYYNAVLYVPFWIALHVRALKIAPTSHVVIAEITSTSVHLPAVTTGGSAEDTLSLLWAKLTWSVSLVTLTSVGWFTAPCSMEETVDTGLAGDGSGPTYNKTHQQKFIHSIGHFQYSN